MWPLIVVTVAIVAFFVGSTMYSQRIAARLDADAASIALNSSPSIELLSAARGSVLRAEVAVARAFESAPRDDARERSSAEEALTQLRGYEQRRHEAYFRRVALVADSGGTWLRQNVVRRAVHSLEGRDRSGGPHCSGGRNRR